tara:strand:+ start:868 stop:1806 length:939 start_codon:yes stop_codon:yes gene_type:complete
MAKNPYFLDSTSEQRLVEDLTAETIRSMGRDVYYIPRVLMNKDLLFGEDTVSKFSGSYKIEMYINSVNGFEGQGDIISKFGIEIRDRVELVVSAKRFDQLIGRFDSTIKRPREGDLIYFPLSDTFFEINFVEHENPFYPLGKRYTFVLTCEAFTYSHEDFDSNQDFIDDVQTENSTTGYELYMHEGLTQDFILGETVYQISGDTDSTSIDHVISDATATGRVYDWNGLTQDKVLLVGDVVGNLNTSSGQYIVGASSDIRVLIGTTAGRSDIILPISPETNTNLFDNIEIERLEQSQNIFDFTDKDPFSEGDY